MPLNFIKIKNNCFRVCGKSESNPAEPLSLGEDKTNDDERPTKNEDILLSPSKDYE